MPMDYQSDVEMTVDDSSAQPVACRLTTDDLRRRCVEIADLFADAVAVTEMPGGYGIAFTATSDVRRLVDFVVFERDCCPFLSFALRFPTPHDLVWLQIRGNADAKTMMAEQFTGVRDRLAAKRP